MKVNDLIEVAIAKVHESYVHVEYKENINDTHFMDNFLLKIDIFHKSRK